MVKQSFTYFFLLMSVIVVSLFQLPTDQSPILYQDSLPTLETEFVANYTIDWQEDEACLYKPVSRSRKNMLLATTEPPSSSSLIQNTREIKSAFSIFWYIPISCSILCIYRI